MYTEEQKKILAKRKEQERYNELMDKFTSLVVEIFICTIIGGLIGYLFGLAISS